MLLKEGSPFYGFRLLGLAFWPDNSIPISEVLVILSRLSKGIDLFTDTQSVEVIPCSCIDWQLAAALAVVVHILMVMLNKFFSLSWVFNGEPFWLFSFEAARPKKYVDLTLYDAWFCSSKWEARMEETFCCAQRHGAVSGKISQTFPGH